MQGIDWLQEVCMSSQPPRKTIAALLWDIIRLGMRSMWESRANPARMMLERQQALNVLGLPPNATPQQIKRRYRALAKRNHPDRGGDQKQMQRIIAAYELLMKDPSKG
jgi:hypothetical protein